MGVSPLRLGSALPGCLRSRAEACHLIEGLNRLSKGRAIASGQGQGMRRLDLNALPLPLTPAFLPRRESFSATFTLPVFPLLVSPVEERRPCLLPTGENPLLLLQSPLPDSLNHPKRSKGQLFENLVTQVM